MSPVPVTLYNSSTLLTALQISFLSMKKAFYCLVICSKKCCLIDFLLFDALNCIFQLQLTQSDVPQFEEKCKKNAESFSKNTEFGGLPTPQQF